MRRVVTGTDDRGRAVFVADEALPDPAAGASTSVWAADAMFVLPTDGTEPEHGTFFPPPGGVRFKVVVFGPSGTPEERQAAIPTDAHYTAHATYDPDGSGMHSTESIDVGYIVDGEVHLELDDGAEVLLRAGDTIVQNGTRHNWHNLTDRPCTIVFAILGARRST
jgi:mannose-6-phosphate isomerase-like protein (cupin superfamily)